MSSKNNDHSPSSLIKSEVYEKAVLKRLEDVIESHQVSLARLSIHTNTHTSSSNRNSNRNRNADGNHNHDNDNEVSVAEAALHRSTTTTSNTAVNSSNSTGGILELQLNPLERVNPSDLLADCYKLVDDDNDDDNNDNDNDNDNGYYHNEEKAFTGTHTQTQTQTNHQHHHHHHNTTVKAIAVLATLCEEANELKHVANHTFFPQLFLFSHDLNLDTNTNMDMDLNDTYNYAYNYAYTSNNGHDDTTQNPNHNTNTNTNGLELELDEIAMQKRDGHLLKRMGAFMSTLQQLNNMVTRIHRLLKHMLLQFHGCLNDRVIENNEYDGDNGGDGHDHEEESSIGFRSASEGLLLAQQQQQQQQRRQQKNSNNPHSFTP